MMTHGIIMLSACRISVCWDIHERFSYFYIIIVSLMNRILCINNGRLYFNIGMDSKDVAGEGVA